MTTQQTLAGFSDKSIPIGESTSDFRPWNRVILNWDIDYQGYQRDGEGEEGYLDFQVCVVIRESLVRVKDPQTGKKKEKPGYGLTVFQSVASNGRELDSQVVYEEHFQMGEFPKAFDAFQREVLNVQTWVEIAESRAQLMPNQNDVFECLHCGWVTDTWSDDIICEGCGKRYWSEKLWGEGGRVSSEAC